MKQIKVIAALGLLACGSLAIAQGGSLGATSGSATKTNQHRAAGPMQRIINESHTPVQRAFWTMFIATQTAGLEGETSLAVRQSIIASANLYMRGVLDKSQQKELADAVWNPKWLTEARWKRVLNGPVMVNHLLKLSAKQQGEIKSAWLANQPNWNAYGESLQGRSADAARRIEAMLAQQSDLIDGVRATLNAQQKNEWDRIVAGFRKEMLQAARGR
jgi:hypothetical protein